MSIHDDVDSMLATLTGAREKLNQAQALRERVTHITRVDIGVPDCALFAHQLDWHISMQAVKMGFLARADWLEQEAAILVAGVRGKTPEVADVGRVLVLTGEG